MPDYKPNQLVRAFAVIALVAAFIAVVVVVATSGDGSGGGKESAQSKAEGPTKRGRAAVERGVWIVRSGDTLAGISDQTGIDVDVLIQLNPDLDPQTLQEGQRIALR